MTLASLLPLIPASLALPSQAPPPPYNGRAPGAVGAQKRQAAKERNRRRHKRALGMRGRSR